ncbi:MAG: AAA family ATPase [Chitinivibrionales bacterium]|nr:AAA family ATPase [Chitinivibrionales bacterium]
MKRDIQPKLVDFITSRSIKETLIIEGARQVGKSYLVSSALSDCGVPFKSFDLEKEPRLLGHINQTTSFADFRQLMEDRYDIKPGTILFIDEAQEAPVLAKYIKSFKEDWPDVKVLLSGSSMSRLFDTPVRIPVGRMRSMCVFGFSFSEFARYIAGDDLADFLNSAPEKIEPSRHDYLLELFDHYCKVGGYPEAVKAFKNNESFMEIIENIYFSLADDFRRKEEYQPALFDNTVTAIANYIGMPFKLTAIDTTKYRAKHILEALNAWHLAIEVRQHALDPTHSSFLPKRYLHDIGVCNMKRSIAAPSLSLLNTIDPLLRKPLGGLFENALAISLYNGESASKSIGTWKKSSGNVIEVDFILDYPEKGVKIPIECKAALVAKKKHCTNVRHYLENTGQRFGIVASAAPLACIMDTGCRHIINIPIYLCSKENIRTYFDRGMEGLTIGT